MISIRRCRSTIFPICVLFTLFLISAHANASTDAVVLPTASPRVLHYERLQYIVGFGGLFYYLLLLWGLVATGLASKVRQFSERAGKYKIVVLALTILLLTSITFVLNLPLSFYGGYILPHEFGQSTETLSKWFRDLFVGHFLNVGVYFLAFAGLFFVINRSPGRWPLWCWLASIPVTAFSLFAQPLYIDPLFNHFSLLSESRPLYSQIEALAAKAGIPQAPIYIVDMSSKTRDVNAYVTGIGDSARIVIWDTTIQKLPTDQVLAMVGHEMGHYVLHHVYLSFFESLAGLALLFPICKWILSYLLSKRGKQWGVVGLTDPAAIPLFLLLVSISNLVMAPVSSALSRQVEAQADAFGIQLTGNPVAMAKMFVSIAKIDLSNPDPPAIIQFMYGDHPTLRERVNTALSKEGSRPF